MDLSEWNDRIFNEAVARVGRPGDPLYFYVDDDVLASASGGLSSEDALHDFCAALQGRIPALRFQQAAEQSQLWKEADYEGVCPYAWALALTVLGVSLPPLGRSSNNVYGRTRDLLGLPIEGGAPAGYTDWVPTLWNRWNDWLESYGREFGTCTAYPTGTQTFQGWARSQSFIRAADKEDIFDFFEEAALPADVSPKVLLRGLQRWLIGSGRNGGRLAQRVNDPGLSDEFMTFLESAWRAFEPGGARIRRTVDVPGTILWNQDDGLLDLVVDVAQHPVLIGAQARTFAGVDFAITAADRVLFLTEENVPPESWFFDPVHDWELAPGARVQRDVQGLYRFSPHEQGWLEDRSNDARFPMLLLLPDEDFPKLESAVSAAKVSRAPISGWSWVTIESPTGIDVTELRSAVSIGAAEQRRRVARLVGGLPTRSRVYLDQGEPDLVLEAPPECTQVLLNGVEVTGYLIDDATDEESVELTVAAGRRRLRLADLYDGPGLKTVEVRYEDSVERFNLTVVAAERHMSHHVEVQVMVPSDAPVRVASDLAGFVCDLDGRSELVRSEAPMWMAALDLNQFASYPRLLDLSDAIKRARADSGYLVVQTGTRASPRWTVHPFDRDERGGSQASASVAVEPDSIVTSFVMASPEHIHGPLTSLDVRQLQERLLNYRRRDSRPVIGRSASAVRSADRRRDVLPGPSTTHNSYNKVLEWLSELSEPSVSVRKFDDVWRWANNRVAVEDRHATRSAIQLLEALGHVRYEYDRQRVTLLPSTLVRLPDSAGTHVLVGSRPELVVDAIQTGTPGWDDAGAGLEDALQSVILQPVHDIHASSPDTYFVRFEMDDDVWAGIEQMGIRYAASDACTELLKIPSLDTQIQKASSLERFPGNRYEIWQYREARESVRGRWKAVYVLPSEGEHFVRVTQGRLRRWCWYSGASAQLRDVGWVSGRWAVERQAKSDFLVRHDDHARRLYVSATMPIDPHVRASLTLLTGMAPREIVLEGQDREIARLAKRLAENLGDASGATDYRPLAPRHKYHVYEGVDSVLAERVKAALGQRGEASHTIVPVREEREGRD